MIQAGACGIVVVAKEDKDIICFLWWPEGDFSGEPKQYRMTAHLFGAVSSPSCASYALRKAAEDNKWDLSADTVEAVKCNFYVDSCLMSLGSEEEAIRMVKELNARCKLGGFIWRNGSAIVEQCCRLLQKINGPRI